MKSVLKYFLWLILLFVLAFAGFIIYITIVDYHPEKIEVLSLEDNTHPVVGDTLKLMAWNIGYAGLGAEMDFFYDNGNKVRPTKEMSRKYLDEIKKFLVNNSNIDFWLLQELDIEARRSHYKNEVKEIEELLPSYYHVFAKNYDVPFVPVPLYEPLGFVMGGMCSFSKHTPLIAERFAYPLIASWPNKLFLLDRCFILTRYSLPTGKDLVILNTHNSAYVYDSILRLKELQIIKEKMLEEYTVGNYIIAGGDWNANPPYFQPGGDYNGHRFIPSPVKMNPDFLPNEWQWAYDPSAPTNRQNYQAFKKGENGTTSIDYFIVSPNVEILEVKTIDLNFENSDHNPVFLKVKINPG